MYNKYLYILFTST